MSLKNEHINYSAADIARYHKGELSSLEMHAMEKAALDDPFLADALEGYAVPGVQAEQDMSLLRQKLAARIADEANKAPVVPLMKTRFHWWKVAAMIVLVAGAGTLIYQLGFNNSDNQMIAKEETKPAEETTVSPVQQNKADGPLSIIDSSSFKQVPGSPSSEKKQENKLPAPVVADNNKDQDKSSATPAQPVTAPPVFLETDTKANNVTQADRPAKQADIAQAAKERKADDQAAVIQQRSVAAKAKAEPGQALNNNNRANVFRGRVTDVANNALPFANITNEADNVGTYTDARGYFVLTSPDSVLNVQVRSVGFENSQARLNNQATTNQVVMQEDRSLQEVVLSRNQVNTNRSRSANMLLEEPEPADGWSKYDTYIANNIQIPDTYTRQRSTNYNTGVVELSFEVDAQGNPVNIKVEKSLCESCDKEAIRLVKDGPKWKSKSIRKKGRTTVAIPF